MEVPKNTVDALFLFAIRYRTVLRGEAIVGLIVTDKTVDASNTQSSSLREFALTTVYWVRGIREAKVYCPPSITWQAKCCATPNVFWLFIGFAE